MSTQTFLDYLDKRTTGIQYVFYQELATLLSLRIYLWCVYLSCRLKLKYIWSMLSTWIYHSWWGFFPIKTLYVDVIKWLGIEPEKFKYITKSQVIKDSAGALNLAKCPIMTPASKSIAVNYHWSCDKIQNGELTVENIGGDVHKGDIFTKGLQVRLFLYIRNLIFGC